jgi:hypothetical protein
VIDLPMAEPLTTAIWRRLIDPRDLASQLRGKERAWLRRRKELLERTAEPWQRLPDEDANNGHIAFRIITGL